jgi:hypothetical protein
MAENNEKTACYEPESESSADIESSSTLISASTTMIKNLWYKSHLVYGILFSQPQSTKIDSIHTEYRYYHIYVFLL